MKKFIVSLAVLFLFVISISKQSYVINNWNRKIIEKSLGATVVVIIDVANKEYLGAGVIIKPDGTILTAAHVVNHKNANMFAATYKGNEYNLRVLYINKYRDLALVQPFASAQKFEWLKIQKSNDLWIGEDILVIGHPFGNLYTVTTGTILRLPFYLKYFCQIMEINALIGHGSSGGPVLNKKGEIIGIVSAMQINFIGQSLGVGIAIPVEVIHRFLSSYNNYLIKEQQIKRHQLGELYER
jgi:S1-C subfamily serine protease